MLPLRELPLIFHRPLPDPHGDARAVGNARLLHAGRRVSRAPSQAGSDPRFPVAAHARADRSRRRRAGGCATATGETPRACPNASPGRLSRGKINKMCVWARGDDRKITRATDPPAGSHQALRGNRAGARWHVDARGGVLASGLGAVGL